MKFKPGDIVVYSYENNSWMGTKWEVIRMEEFDSDSVRLELLENAPSISRVKGYRTNLRSFKLKLLNPIKRKAHLPSWF